MKSLYSTPTSNPLLFKLTVTERPNPTLEPSQPTVLVRVRAAGINPSDSANALKNLFRSTKPIIPGRDFAGIVEASGSSSYQPGAHVYGTSGDILGFSQDGTSAEFVLVPETLLVPKPSGLTFAQAGAVGTPYTTALQMLEQARTVAGKDRVLVLGANGAVGTAAVRIARHWGCKVVTASRRDSTDVNISKDPGLVRLSDILNGRGPDVVIDTVGSAALMSATIKLLAPKGRYATCSAGKGETVLELDLLMLYRQGHTICGINSISQAPETVGAMLQKLNVMFEQGLEGPTEGKLIKISLEESVKAYGEAMEFAGEKSVIMF